MTIILIDDFAQSFDTLCDNAKKFLQVPWQPPQRSRYYEEFKAVSKGSGTESSELVIMWFKTGEDFISWLDEDDEGDKKEYKEGEERKGNKLAGVSMILLDELLGTSGKVQGHDIYHMLRELKADDLVYGVSAERSAQPYLPEERYLGMASVLTPSWIGRVYTEYSGPELR